MNENTILTVFLILLIENPKNILGEVWQSLPTLKDNIKQSHTIQEIADLISDWSLSNDKFSDKFNQYANRGLKNIPKREQTHQIIENFLSEFSPQTIENIKNRLIKEIDKALAQFNS